MDNFYQNHRRYVKSRSFDQLKGADSYADSDCDPIKLNSDVNPIKLPAAYDKSVNLVLSDPAWPCGLVAKSYFNDTYSLYKGNTKDKANQVVIDETGIAWDSDKTYKFKENPSMHQKYWLNVTDGKLLFNLNV